MAIPLLDAREDCRSILDENVAAFWTDADLDRWIYQGARDLARYGEVLRDVKSYTVEANRFSYDAPELLLRMHRAEYRRSGVIYPLEIKPLLELDEIWWISANEVPVGTPAWLTMWGTPGIGGSQLRLYPTPSETLDDGFRVFYYRLPMKPVQNDDLVEVPVGWEELITQFVEWRALRKAGSQRAREAKDSYESARNEMIAMTRQPSDGMQHIQADVFAGSWLGSWDQVGW